MSSTPWVVRPTVAVVDDSEEIRAILHRLLVSAGFEVVGEGSDGDEAILLAHREHPGILLLDTSMPKVDGIEALPAILAVSPETRVVVFTGLEEPGLADRMRELGAADFVAKSIRLDDLPQRLMQVWAVPHPEPAATSGGGAVDLPYAGPPPVAEPDPEGQSVLSEHVQQFREMFDRAEIGMATLTSSGTVVRANKALAAMMSCSPDDLVGVDYGRLTVGQGDELDRRLDDICTLDEDVTSFEHQLPEPRGVPAFRVVRVTLAPIRDARGNVLYVFAQIQDVTAQRALESNLRRSEENFRRLVTAVSEYAIFLLDREGTVVSWNSGAQRIKGYTAGEIVGRSFRVFYPREEQAAGTPERNLQIALLEGSYVDEGWRVRKDGSRFWAYVVITPVYDDAGRHVGFAKVTRDQTRQREHEEERRTFLEQRIHLLGETAHELRSPTSVIDGSAAALGASWDGLSPDERNRLLGGIRNSADRLRRLAADLAAAAESAGDMMPLQLEEISLADMVERAVRRVHVTQADVRILTDVPTEAVFPADGERLAQALDNLLHNAVRHGRPPITVSAAVDVDVRIRVTDHGPGVATELVPHLFERFATEGATGGTGLGLHLVREIARLHGGDVSYHPPTDDAPTAFEIRLPRQPARDGAASGHA